MGVVIIKELIFTVSTLVAGVVVLKEHNLTVSTFGKGCGGVEGTDF